MHSQVTGAFVVVAAMFATSCADCNRDGCDALSVTSVPGGTGIAGVVAMSSDVVSNGCQECPFGEATLSLWQVSLPASDVSEAEATVTARAPDVQFDVSGRYTRALEAGSYLLCVQSSCIGIDVTNAKKLTINIKRRYGPTGFFIGTDGSLTERFGFEVRQ